MHRADDHSPTPPPRGSWRDGFARRLGVYLFGTAIGLVLLGSIQRCKSASRPPAAHSPTESASPSAPAAPVR